MQRDLASIAAVAGPRGEPVAKVKRPGANPVAHSKNKIEGSGWPSPSARHLRGSMKMRAAESKSVEIASFCTQCRELGMVCGG